MSKIGLRDFEDQAIYDNFDALARALAKKRPDTLKGKYNILNLVYHHIIGKYFLKAYIKTSMGSPIKVNLS